jgi:hypothetical protein
MKCARERRKELECVGLRRSVSSLRPQLTLVNWARKASQGLFIYMLCRECGCPNPEFGARFHKRSCTGSASKSSIASP